VSSIVSVISDMGRAQPNHHSMIELLEAVAAEESEQKAAARSARAKASSLRAHRTDRVDQRVTGQHTAARVGREVDLTEVRESECRRWCASGRSVSR
jgi:hypothetical protein